ncbi:MAG: sigma-54 dependent transcriptional regulator [Pseudomonadales bacterium]|nr:sigma-54 dependent transcriptional regulator [Pseudomonadales bacterium]
MSSKAKSDEVEQSPFQSSKSSGQVISVAPASIRSFQLAERVAATHVSVLIYGDSGTGKEVIARHIHNHSPRKTQPFIAINCAAIPEQMLEAMLFGHEKGAYTGAHSARQGKFELANGGTLLLDEISEMDLSLQAKLLRVLQEREVERVGGKLPIPVDVRIVATTNRDLKEAIKNGTFREDLYYRLNVFPIYVAPLKERIEDILPLAAFFLERHSQQIPSCARKLSAEAAVMLQHYEWPGNVRELENMVQRALVMCDGNELCIADFDLDMCISGAPVQSVEQNADRIESHPGAGETQLDNRMRNEEVQIVQQVLSQQLGNRKKSAAQLGISQRTLRHKMQKWREQGIELEA